MSKKPIFSIMCYNT